MAAGRSALAVVLLACAVPLLVLPTGGGVRGADDDKLSWCGLENCTCRIQDSAVDGRQITVICNYSGDKVSVRSKFGEVAWGPRCLDPRFAYH